MHILLITIIVRQNGEKNSGLCVKLTLVVDHYMLINFGYGATKNIQDGRHFQDDRHLLKFLILGCLN